MYQFKENSYAVRDFEHSLASVDALPMLALVRLLEAKGLITRTEFDQFYREQCEAYYIAVSESSDTLDK